MPLQRTGAEWDACARALAPNPTRVRDVADELPERMSFVDSESNATEIKDATEQAVEAMLCFVHTGEVRWDQYMKIKSLGGIEN